MPLESKNSSSRLLFLKIKEGF